MQPKNEIGRGPLTLSRAIAQLRPSPGNLERGRPTNQDMEIRALHLALEAKLQECERWECCVNTLIQHLEQGVVVADGKGFVTLLNGQGERILGLPHSQVVGQPLNQVLQETGLPSLPFSTYEHGGRLLNGQEIPLPGRNPFPSGVNCSR